MKASKHHDRLREDDEEEERWVSFVLSLLLFSYNFNLISSPRKRTAAKRRAPVDSDEDEEWVLHYLSLIQIAYLLTRPPKNYPSDDDDEVWVPYFM